MRGKIKKIFYSSSIIIFLMFIIHMPPVHSDVAFISNESVLVSKMTKNELNKILLGKTVNWNDGSKINLAVYKKDADLEIHKKTIRKYTMKSAVQFQRWWRKLAFTGKGTIPKSFGSEEDLIKFIKNKEGSIGYVNKEKIADSVKVIVIN